MDAQLNTSERQQSLKLYAAALILGSLLPLAFAPLLIAWSLVDFPSYDALALGEDGIIEALHVILPLAALGLALWLMARPAVRCSGPFLAWLGLAALGCRFSLDQVDNLDLDPARLAERFGHTGVPRPPGPLVFRPWRRR